jgi:hypothetical protein
MKGFLFILLLSHAHLFCQVSKYQIDFKVGEFNFKYIERCKSSISNEIPKIDTFNIKLNLYKMNSLILEYSVYQNDSLIKRIYNVDNQLCNFMPNSKVDTLIMIHSYLQNNLFDRSKVKSSIPYSGIYLFKKNRTYIIDCDFTYYNKKWFVLINLNRGVIIGISRLLSRDINGDRNKGSNDLGCMYLVEKKIFK